MLTKEEKDELLDLLKRLESMKSNNMFKGALDKEIQSFLFTCNDDSICRILLKNKRRFGSKY